MADAARVCRLLASVAVVLAIGVLASCHEDAPALAGHLAKAKELLSRRQYPSALAAFDEVLAIDPRHFEARRLRAEILYNTAHLEEAAAILLVLRKEKATDLDVAWGLAMIRKDQMRFAEALAYFDSMPVDERPMFPMAETLAGLRRYAEASNWLGQYLCRHPFDSKGYYLLSKIEFHRGRDASGKFWGAFYRGREKQRREDGQARGMEHAGKTIDAKMFRAQKMCERGRFFEGLQELSGALRIDGNVPMAYFMIGQIMASVGNSEDAVAAFDRVLAMQPGEPRVMAARAAEQKNLQASGGTSLTPVAAAKRFAALAHQDDARAAALFAAQTNPQDPAALRLVVQLFNRRGDAFLRLWALRLAIGLLPEDRGLAAAWHRELGRLGMKF